MRAYETQTVYCAFYIFVFVLKNILFGIWQPLRLKQELLKGLFY